MTGFARAEAVHPWGTLSCEIRSVNHRYLELQLRVPEALRHAEHASRELLRERLGRGKVDCSLRLQDSAGAAGAEGGVLRVDEDRLAQLLAACARIDTVAPGLARPTTLEMLAWPGVLAEEAPDADTTAGAMLALVERTARELVEAREREGARLGALLTQRLSGIEELVATVRQRLPELIAGHRDRLAQRVAELAVQAEPERLAQEIALLAARGDVAEELDRLTVHVGETRRSLAAGGACGRRLDFLMQEFNREANTLSSKSVAAETTQAAVDMKVLIEQMREQVQNIE
jgi:uncharacterized protein (TIGR00255 family)